jgi:hypothetical protein
LSRGFGKKVYFFLQYHHYHIVKVENEQSSIEKHEVEPSVFPTGCGRDSRADEEKHIHIEACDDTNSADSIDNRSNIGDVKLIGLVEFKVVNEFLKHCGLPLSFLHLYYTTLSLICQGVLGKKIKKIFHKNLLKKLCRVYK